MRRGGGEGKLSYRFGRGLSTPLAVSGKTKRGVEVNRGQKRKKLEIGIGGLNHSRRGGKKSKSYLI